MLSQLTYILLPAPILWPCLWSLGCPDFVILAYYMITPLLIGDWRLPRSCCTAAQNSRCGLSAPLLVQSNPSKTSGRRSLKDSLLYTFLRRHLAVRHYHCSCLMRWFRILGWVFTLIQKEQKYIFFFLPRSAQPHLSLWYWLLSISHSAFMFYHLPAANLDLLCLICASPPLSQLKNIKDLLEFT